MARSSSGMLHGLDRLNASVSAAVALLLPPLLLAIAVVIGIGLPGFDDMRPVAGAPSFAGGLVPSQPFDSLRPDFVKSVLGQSFGGRETPSSSISPSAFLPAPSVHIPAHTNDSFANAYPITSIPFSADVDTKGAARRSGEPAGCGDGGTIWFRYVAPKDEGIALIAKGETSQAPVNATVYQSSGPGLANLNQVVCGATNVQFAVVKNATYYLQIADRSAEHVRVVFGSDGTTERESYYPDGSQSPFEAFQPLISRDGRFVAFTMAANDPTDPNAIGCTMQNLHRPFGPVDPNQIHCNHEIWIRDRVNHLTELVSVDSNGKQMQYDHGLLSISGDGRFVVFTSFASLEGAVPEAPRAIETVGETQNVYVRDRLLHTTTLVSKGMNGFPANGISTYAEISADGRFIAFDSDASNLVPNDTNNSTDVFLWNRMTQTIKRISVSVNGQQANADTSRYNGNKGSFIDCLSADGRFIVFHSTAQNLIPGLGNGVENVFELDRVSHKLLLVNVSSRGEQADGDSSNDGWIAGQCVSDDGRFVAFNSTADNLVPETGSPFDDVYVRDTVLGLTERASVSSTGERPDDGFNPQQNRRSTDFTPLFWNIDQTAVQGWLPYGYSMTPDGRYVCFESVATNVVPGDSDSVMNTYRHDRATGTTMLFSVASGGAHGPGDSFGCSMSGSGNAIAFWTADALSPDDTNNNNDVYVHELLPNFAEPNGTVL
ncbi:MAG: TolB-like translocation protein [Actinomycetota bacterium]